MVLVFFTVSILSCTVGSICGIGGGVIIKPVLDATGIMGVSSISFFVGLYRTRHVRSICL